MRCREAPQATHDFCGNLRLGTGVRGDRHVMAILHMASGYGSFGGVFRGIQKDGTEVAIKALGSAMPG